MFMFFKVNKSWRIAHKFQLEIIFSSSDPKSIALILYYNCSYYYFNTCFFKMELTITRHHNSFHHLGLDGKKLFYFLRTPSCTYSHSWKDTEQGMVKWQHTNGIEIAVTIVWDAINSPANTNLFFIYFSKAGTQILALLRERYVIIQRVYRNILGHRRSTLSFSSCLHSSPYLLKLLQDYFSKFKCSSDEPLKCWLCGYLRLIFIESLLWWSTSQFCHLASFLKRHLTLKWQDNLSLIHQTRC